MTSRHRWAGAFTVLLAACTFLVGSPAGAPAATDGTAGKIAGMFVKPFLANDAPAEINRIHGDGMNMAALSVYWYVDNESDNTMHRGDYTAPDDRLVADITAAHAAGMRAALAPTLICSNCEAYWRGNLHPSDPAQFFANYQQFLLHYAQLAADNKVELFFVGTEMKSLEGAQYTADWDQTIAQVRAVFPGQVTYNVNWDSLTGPQFWDRLDLVSVSGFMPLTGVEHPSVGDFKAGWKDSPIWGDEHWVDDLVALHRRTGKPILFGECGYMSSTYNGRRPYDDSDVHDPDWQAQANAYQAVLETFEPQPWWAGVLWWEWVVTNNDPNATDRTPRGKKVEQLLNQWYAQGVRPSSQSPTETTTPNAPRAAPDPRGRSAPPPPLPAPRAPARVPARPATTLAAAPVTTTTTAPPRAAPSPTPGTADPLAGFEARMSRQQALAARVDASDARLHRASKVAGILVVFVLLGHAGFAVLRARLLPATATGHDRA